MSDRPLHAAQTSNGPSCAADTTAQSRNAATANKLIRLPLSVRWGDLDAFNHVNNAAFLEYAQEARIAWFAQIHGTWKDATMMPVVAAAHVNFRRQLCWPAHVVIELTAARVGNSSLTLAHRIVDASDHECLYADGDSVMVWIEPASGHSIGLPEAIRAACQSPVASAATTSK